DAEVDQAHAGVRVAMRLGPTLHLGEEIARLQVQERLVDPGHVAAPFTGCEGFYAIAAGGPTASSGPAPPRTPTRRPRILIREADHLNPSSISHQIARGQDASSRSTTPP